MSFGQIDNITMEHIYNLLRFRWFDMGEMGLILENVLSDPGMKPSSILRAGSLKSMIPLLEARSKASAVFFGMDDHLAFLKSLDENFVVSEFFLRNRSYTIVGVYIEEIDVASAFVVRHHCKTSKDSQN